MGSVASRLRELEANLVELEAFKNLPLEAVRGDRRLQWALRYGVLESLQIMIDVACALASRRNLGHPRSYADCLRLLERHSYLPTSLADRLVRAVGMRNVLIHDYLDVDDTLVYGALDDLQDLRDFAVCILQAEDDTPSAQP